MAREQAVEMVSTTAALGWQLGIHAIGDVAIEIMTGVYHQELAAHPRADHRWFLAHLTMIPSVETLRTLAQDRVYGAAQPNFLYNLVGPLCGHTGRLSSRAYQPGGDAAALR